MERRSRVVLTPVCDGPFRSGPKVVDLEAELVACLEDLGFTTPCAQIWYWNTLNTQDACLAECLAALDEPYNEPDGSLNAAGVPCGPIYSVDQVFADPQVQHLGIAAPLAFADAAGEILKLLPALARHGCLPPGAVAELTAGSVHPRQVADGASGIAKLIARLNDEGVRD